MRLRSFNNTVVILFIQILLLSMVSHGFALNNCLNDADILSISSSDSVNLQHYPIKSIRMDDHIIPMIQELHHDLTIGFIEDLTSFGPRPTGSSACNESADYIYDQFQSMGLSVRYQNWSHTDTFSGNNIEAVLPGVDERSDEIYIVCGHYDTVSVSPGADDNAAGTSVVLSLAAILSQYHFNHTIRFVAFSGEEEGKIGSYYYVYEAFENQDNIVGVLNADMMGYASSEEGQRHVVVYDNDDSTWLREYTTDIADLYHDLIYLDVVHGGQSGRSDHATFYAADYHAISFFEYDLNPYYHTSKDTLETMNTGYANIVSKLALATIASLAEYVQLHPPEQPSRPIGSSEGRPGEPYMFSSSAVDADSDDLFYIWDFGDGSYSDWMGPYRSGEECEVEHIWEQKGTFEVRVKVKDIYGDQSNWSEPLSVSMPKVFDKILFFRSLLEPIILRFNTILG